MICLGDRVNRLGQKSPTGIIEQINEDNTATVLWGVSDGIKYTEDVNIWKLQHAV